MLLTSLVVTVKTKCNNIFSIRVFPAHFQKGKESENRRRSSEKHESDCLT